MESGWEVNQTQHLALLMELVMTNGWSRIFGKRRGLETGDPTQFKSFEDVRDAFRKQVVFEMKRGAIASNLGEQLLQLRRELDQRTVLGVGAAVVGAASCRESCRAWKALPQLPLPRASRQDAAPTSYAFSAASTRAVVNGTR